MRGAPADTAAAGCPSLAGVGGPGGGAAGTAYGGRPTAWIGGRQGALRARRAPAPAGAAAHGHGRAHAATLQAHRGLW
jgi:hypothetical protein